MTARWPDWIEFAVVAMVVVSVGAHLLIALAWRHYRRLSSLSGRNAATDTKLAVLTREMRREMRADREARS